LVARNHSGHSRPFKSLTRNSGVVTWGPRESAGWQECEGDEQPCGRGLDCRLAVFGESSGSVDPAEGPFDDPTLRGASPSGREARRGGEGRGRPPPGPPPAGHLRSSASAAFLSAGAGAAIGAANPRRRVSFRNLGERFVAPLRRSTQS
jgi:hypothetical protein